MKVKEEQIIWRSPDESVDDSTSLVGSILILVNVQSRKIKTLKHVIAWRSRHGDPRKGELEAEADVEFLAWAYFPKGL